MTVLATKLLTNATVDDCKEQCLNMSYHDQCTGFLFILAEKRCILLYGQYGHQRPVDMIDLYTRDCDFESELP